LREIPAAHPRFTPPKTFLNPFHQAAWPASAGDVPARFNGGYVAGVVRFEQPR